MSVAVIGGGIIGLATAYILAERDVDVVVFEQSTLGQGATERAIGGIRAQFSTPVNVALSKRSIETWESFDDEFGIDIEFNQHGYLFLTADQETADKFADRVTMQQDLGVPSEFIPAEAATEYLPELYADSYVAAAYCPRDGSADPHLALQAYSEAAVEAGADIRFKTTVTDIRRSGDEVTGVETDDGAFEADTVVNAAGAWAAQVATLADIDIPVSPRRRQVVTIEPEIPYPETAPLTFDMDSAVYFAPDRDGEAMVGGHFADEDPEMDPDRYSTSFDMDWAMDAMDRAETVTGHFGLDSKIKEGWAGLYAVTPDHHPIIEETVPGFVQAVGFSGHGFMHAPAVAEIVADLVQGEVPPIDVDELGSERFEDEMARAEEHVL